MNEAALLTMLTSGKIRYTGIDVFADEPPTTEPALELLRCAQVFATSHIGASTLEAQKRVSTDLARAVCEFVHNN